ncbi:unnamed protein product [Nippostrongylus brasiliensis]|uniref:Cytochrome c oxidase accessory protein CcoG n=1 Tax=Nippostrongylus brasiliensis TaxID=27835 RepID=A0A0N4YU58_NIPBR|nr:unnamed protein product [Nippostrongylus brasiliensis]
MLFWEWRRILRQKIRNTVPRSKLTYQQWSKRRLITAFVMFFIGWKVFGVTLSDYALWEVNELTGEGRLMSPREGRERRFVYLSIFIYAE